MIKEILLGERLVRYDLKRKKVKNINIRIKHDLSVHISASPHVSQKSIEEILTEKADFILSALEKYESLALSDDFDAKDGDTVTVFGQKLPITTVSGKKDRANIGENEIILTLKDASDIALRQKVLNSALDALLRDTVEKLCREIYPKFSANLPDYPTVKFRHMKSRWGSCNCKKYILTFNYSLVHAPRECIEYVIYHEFTHFIHPNHSRDFYMELASHLPHHKSLRQQLNKININY